VFWYTKAAGAGGVSNDELEAVKQQERDMMAEVGGKQQCQTILLAGLGSTAAGGSSEGIAGVFSRPGHATATTAASSCTCSAADNCMLPSCSS
jgi:hypothetical protein